MTEHRKFPRIPSSLDIELVHQGRRHTGCLDNVSLSGALVHLDGEADVGTGEICLLKIHLEKVAAPLPPLEICCQAIHGSAHLVGVKFVSCDTEASRRLLLVLEHMRDKTDRVQDDLDRIRGYLADYCGTR